MPPKPKAKPRVVPRRGAAASAPPSGSGSASAASLTPATDGSAPPSTHQADAAADAQPLQSPAPIAPIAPPAGRLDSLAPKTATAGVRGTSAPPVKFKPKNPGRRSKEERDNLNAKFQQTPAVGRSRGGISSRGTRGLRGGRGRGGGFSERGGGFERQSSFAPATASGPFALGSITSGQRSKIAVERGVDSGKYRESFGTTSKFEKKFQAKAEEASEIAEKEPEYYSSEDSEGPKMDVEYISLLDEENSDDEDKGADGAPSNWGAGAPVRVPRSEHIDRTALINTDASSRKGKADLKARGNESQFEDSVKVKDEPADEDGTGGWPPSPDASRRVKVQPPSPETKKKDVTKSPSKTRRRSGSTKSKPLFSSLEEKEELERDEFDRLATLQELAGSLSDARIGTGGDTEMTDGAAAPRRAGNTEIENHIFFFQFPTLLPQLIPCVPIEEKKEELPPPDYPTKSAVTATTTTTTATTATTAIPKPTASSSSKAPPPPPSPLPPPPIEATKMAPPPKPTPKALLKAQQTLLESFPPPGIAGKLRIHKSGRITMLWGDPHSDSEPFEMEVSRGAHCEFLQEVVVVQERSPWGEEDVDDRGARKGAAFSLGQVKGKFVVSPDFERLVKGEKRKVRKGKGKEKEKEKEEKDKRKGKEKETARVELA